MGVGGWGGELHGASREFKFIQITIATLHTITSHTVSHAAPDALVKEGLVFGVVNPRLWTPAASSLKPPLLQHSESISGPSVRYCCGPLQTTASPLPVAFAASVIGKAIFRQAKSVGRRTGGPLPQGEHAGGAVYVSDPVDCVGSVLPRWYKSNNNYGDHLSVSLAVDVRNGLWSSCLSCCVTISL